MFEKKITPDILETILELHKEGLSLRAIGDKVGMSYEGVRTYINRHFPKPKENKFILRRRVRNKAPLPIHSTTVKYDFLTNLHLVYKWARVTYDIKIGDIELLLWLYPRGPFSRGDFNAFHKTVSILPRKTLLSLINRGYIISWRKPSKGQKELFTVTNKTKLMCSDMHNFLSGDKAIPTTEKRNGLAKEGAPKFHNYFMKAIKQVNKDRGK